jgi:hypothetical protein
MGQMPEDETREMLEDETREMPEAVREVYDPLFRMVITTHHDWQLMLQVYVGEENVGLLRRFGGIFFGRVQHQMHDAVVLGICRLTDPSRVTNNPKKQSLSIPRLIEAVETDHVGLPDRLKLHEVMKELKAASEPFRKRRNRIIAHRDWETRNELCPVTKVHEIDEALRLAARIMNAVSGHYKNTTDSYTIPPSLGDGDHFMRHLEDYAQRRDQPLRRWKPAGGDSEHVPVAGA